MDRDSSSNNPPLEYETADGLAAMLTSLPTGRDAVLLIANNPTINWSQVDLAFRIRFNEWIDQEPALLLEIIVLRTMLLRHCLTYPAEQLREDPDSFSNAIGFLMPLDLALKMLEETRRHPPTISYRPLGESAEDPATGTQLDELVGMEEEILSHPFFGSLYFGVRCESMRAAADVYMMRYLENGIPSDLHRAVQLYLPAIEDGPEGWPQGRSFLEPLSIAVFYALRYSTPDPEHIRRYLAIAIDMWKSGELASKSQDLVTYVLSWLFREKVQNDRERLDAREIDLTLDVIDRQLAQAATASWPAPFPALPIELLLGAKAQVLHSRYTYFGSQQDLLDAIDLCDQSLESVQDEAWAAGGLEIKGWSLCDLGVLNSNLDLIQQSVNLFRQARGLAREGTAADSIVTGLACALVERYRHTGNQQDLDESSALLESVLESPHLPPSYASSLYGWLLRYRFLTLGQFNDLYQAIYHLQLSREHAPFGSLRRWMDTINVATCLANLSNYTGSKKSYSRAISMLEGVVDELPATSPLRIEAVSSLSHLYIQQNDAELSEAQYDNLIHLLREVCNPYQVTNHVKSFALIVLCELLTARWETSSNRADIDQAIEAFEAAFDRDEAIQWPDMIRQMASGARAYDHRYRAFGDSKDRVAATAIYRQATMLGVSLDLFAGLNASVQWLRFAAHLGELEDAAEAARLGLSVLRSLSMIQGLPEHREVILRYATELSSVAALDLTMRGQDLEAAVVLEQARAILLNEVQDRRTTGLERARQAGRDDLGDRFSLCVEALNSLERTALGASDQGLMLTGLSKRMTATRGELGRVVDEIRRIDGMDDFLRLPGVGDILAAAREAVLVYVGATDFGGFLLAIQPGGQTWHRGLPTLTSDTVLRISTWYASMYRASGAHGERWHAALEWIK